MVPLSRFVIVAALAATPLAASAAAVVMSKTATPADKAFMASMMTMSHDMEAAKPTGNPDRDFAAMMVPHHQGAVAMAKVELDYGKDPALRTMAADIVRSQEKEISQMKAWLAKNAK